MNSLPQWAGSERANLVGPKDALDCSLHAFLKDGFIHPDRKRWHLPLDACNCTGNEGCRRQGRHTNDQGTERCLPEKAGARKPLLKTTFSIARNERRVRVPPLGNAHCASFHADSVFRSQLGDFFRHAAKDDLKL